MDPSPGKIMFHGDRDCVKEDIEIRRAERERKAKKMAKKRILLIDDMPNAAVMLKARLEASGYEVMAAFDGRQGLTYASAKKPDLILLDIVMPTGGGYSVYTRLKRSPKTRSVPVIFLTAKDRPEDVSRAYKLGAQYYLKKPYKPEMLLDTVKKALEPAGRPLQPRGSTKTNTGHRKRPRDGGVRKTG